MKPFSLALSLVALIAALLLLVGDSMPPCDSSEPDHIAYEYSLTCDDALESGSVSFSNKADSWWSVEQVPNEQEWDDEDDPRVPPVVNIALARVDANTSNCRPGSGTAIIEDAWAEAEVSWMGETARFSCKIFPLQDTVTCELGRVRQPWQDDEDEPLPTDEPSELSCSLILSTPTE